METRKNQIIATLQSFGINVAKVEVTTGPAVTLFEVTPAAGTRLSSITSLKEDIALSLSANGIRIIAPMPGRGTVGIEVPNEVKEVVPMQRLLDAYKLSDIKCNIPLNLGVTIGNEVFTTDLAKMPHLLIAGATGQGKSVAINTIIASLLTHLSPTELKLVLIDPKKVELSLYEKISKQYLAKLNGAEEAVITNVAQAIKTLEALTVEMDKRYDLLKAASCRNILEYRKKGNALPYIVLIVDEFADLMMTAGEEVETHIVRLAQLARAVGIHLIVATQRPSVDVITGLIKANFPARISFKVSSAIDSRTILDESGAEQLSGKGDMLLKLDSQTIRLQGAFIDTPEVETMCEELSQIKATQYVFGVAPVTLYNKAVALIKEGKGHTTVYIQKALKVSYTEASNLRKQLVADKHIKSIFSF